MKMQRDFISNIALDVSPEPSISHKSFTVSFCRIPNANTDKSPYLVRHYSSFNTRFSLPDQDYTRTEKLFTMSKPKLIYFNSRGRAEITRYVLAQAGVDYEDVRLTKEEWEKMKPGTTHEG